MTIAVIGPQGQLGRDLLPLLGTQAVALSHAKIDITDTQAIAERLGTIDAQIVINCAAYNLVDKAEQEPEVAFDTNAFGPLNLARYCGEHGLALMHISSDFVFGADAARRSAYTEQDSPGPVSVYGASKLTGEQFVAAYCPRHYIVRTCGLYGQPAPHSKGNFVQTMLRLGRMRDEVRVVCDQRCTPTSTADLAQALVELLATEQYGLYHATNSGETTWAEFARAIFDVAHLGTTVTPITSAEFAAAARRPVYSVLCCDKLNSAIGRSLRPWQAALSTYVQQLPREN